MAWQKDNFYCDVGNIQDYISKMNRNIYEQGDVILEFEYLMQKLNFAWRDIAYYKLLDQFKYFKSQYNKIKVEREDCVEELQKYIDKLNELDMNCARQLDVE